jgi:hypothetical protein
MLNCSAQNYASCDSLPLCTYFLSSRSAGRRGVGAYHVRPADLCGDQPQSPTAAFYESGFRYRSTKIFSDITVFFLALGVFGLKLYHYPPFTTK